MPLIRNLDFEFPERDPAIPVLRASSTLDDGKGLADMRVHGEMKSTWFYSFQILGMVRMIVRQQRQD